jgi:hypothetical protein
MRIPVYAAVVVGLVAVSLAGGDTPPPAAAPTVEELLARLGHQDFRVREAAQRALAALGVEALPALRQAYKTRTDPEVRRRLDALIPPLETAVRVAPKLVTLAVTNRPVRETINELAKQTGYKIDLGNGAQENQVFTFRFDKVPFWKALDEVSRAAGLVLQRSYNNNLNLQFQDSYAPFVCHSGMFRLTAQRFSYSRNIDFSSLPKNQLTTGQRNENLNCSLSVTVEPRMQLLDLGQVKLTEAYDEDRKAMIPAGEGVAGVTGRHTYYYHRSEGNYTMQTDVALVNPSPRSRTVKVLKGILPVTLLVEKKPQVLVDDILKAKGKKAKVGGTELAVQDVTEEQQAGRGKVFRVSIYVQEEGQGRVTNYWYHSFPERVELEDAKGNKYFRNGASWGTQGNGLHGSFNFSTNNNVQIGPPAKFTYYTWVTMQHQVNFEFKDLPLP